MKDEEFKAKLSEVAEWKIPETTYETTVTAKRKRGRKSNEELYQELSEEIFQEEFGGVNNTIPPMVLKLKVQPTTCDDCGKHCANGRQKEKKLYEANQKKHWREKCLTCNLWRDPYSGRFELTSANASIVWNSYCRDVKKRNVTKKVQPQTKYHDYSKTVIEDGEESITIYHDNLSQR